MQVTRHTADLPSHSFNASFSSPPAPLPGQPASLSSCLFVSLVLVPPASFSRGFSIFAKERHLVFSGLLCFSSAHHLLQGHSTREKSKGLLLFSKCIAFLGLLSPRVTEVLSHRLGGQHLRSGCLQGGLPPRAMGENWLRASPIASGGLLAVFGPGLLEASPGTLPPSPHGVLPVYPSVSISPFL